MLRFLPYENNLDKTKSILLKKISSLSFYLFNWCFQIKIEERVLRMHCIIYKQPCLPKWIAFNNWKISCIIIANENNIPPETSWQHTIDYLELFAITFRATFFSVGIKNTHCHFWHWKRYCQLNFSVIVQYCPCCWEQIFMKCDIILWLLVYIISHHYLCSFYHIQVLDYQVNRSQNLQWNRVAPYRHPQMI